MSKIIAINAWRSTSRLLVLSCYLALAVLSIRASAATELRDDELSAITGQALIFTNKVVDNTQAITFYTIGMDTQIDLNANINHLQLGCGGVNGAGACDIDINQFSMSGTPGVNGCPASGSTASCDLRLTRPSITLAISGDPSGARQLVGLQLGAQNIQGQLGYGSINSFSGYLSATTTATMQAGTNVAVTCGPDTSPCTGSAQQYCNTSGCGGGPGGLGFLSGGITATGVNQYGYTGTQSLGLKDDYTCSLLICSTFDGITVNFSQQTSNASVLMSGNRQTQAQISGLNLGTLVENVASSITFNQSNGLPAGLLTLIKGLVQTQMELSIENQFGSALSCNQTTQFNTCPGITPQTGSGNCVNTAYNCVGTSSSEPTQAATLNKYVMPYNLSNMHTSVINSNNFGLSFEKAAVQWPNYVAAVPIGWAMYLPNAFNLTINQPQSVFTSNLVSGQASAGNIAPLPAPPQNCYGIATFC